jgi:hypothetical protein
MSLTLGKNSSYSEVAMQVEYYIAGRKPPHILNMLSSVI